MKVTKENFTPITITLNKKEEFDLLMLAITYMIESSWAVDNSTNIANTNALILMKDTIMSVYKE